MKHDKQKDRDTLAYQELVTAPLDWAFNEDDDGVDKDDDSNKENEDLAVTIKSAIEKVSKSLHFVKIMIDHVQTQLYKVIQAVRSSPQCQQAWYTEVKIMLQNLDTSPIKIALMLILDVKTRWSSTHQMLCKSKWSESSKQHLIILSSIRTLPWFSLGHW